MHVSCKNDPPSACPKITAVAMFTLGCQGMVSMTIVVPSVLPLNCKPTHLFNILSLMCTVLCVLESPDLLHITDICV